MMEVYQMKKKEATFTIPSDVVVIEWECEEVWKIHPYLELLKSENPYIFTYDKKLRIRRTFGNTDARANDKKQTGK